MICSQCKKEVPDNEIYTLAKTHNKYFLVQGIMKGSYTSKNLVFCEDCSKKVDLSRFSK